MNTHVLTVFIALVSFPLSAAAEWWTVLGDSTLNSLEERALSVNYDVDAALRRVEMAQRQLAVARAAYYPTVGVSAGWEKERREPSQWNIGATLSWEIDLFGRVRENARKSKAQIRADRADLEGTRMSVAASVAQAYVQLRQAQESLALASNQAADQKKVADMVQARYDAGLADRLDVAQALTTYYSTCASMPSLQSSISASINALAALLAVYPTEIAGELTLAAPLPGARGVLMPAEIPADEIRNRPDVMAAEAQIDVAAASLGIARKEYLPTLSLTGSISTAHHSLNDLFTDESFGYSVAPTLSWTVFDGMARRANVRIAREQMEIAIDSYNQAMLSGFEEVQNALTAYGNAVQSVELLNKTVEQSDIALDKALALYKLDLTNFTSVMQSQMSLLTYRTQLIDRRAEIVNSFINFHKALGH